MKRLQSIILFVFISISLFAQNIEFIGAGNDTGIKVYTSSDMTNVHGTHSASGSNTISGIGLDYHQISAARFLRQASLGANLDQIKLVADYPDFETWIDDQAAIEPSLMTDKINDVFQEVSEWYILNGGDPENIGIRPSWLHWNYAWWDLIMQNEDLLRHRIALALSEILVISTNSELSGFGDGLASFYDIFVKNAFGNYQDILSEVSLHPCMGFYLSHLNNPRSIPEENIHPDENYAREIMQLFSVGLYELNLDGTRKLDMNNDWIPTYTQQDIKGLAKVFTGLGIADVHPEMDQYQVYFGSGIYIADMTLPMKMYENWHEAGEKSIINGFTIPNGQSGMKDIEDAVNHLFNHPNVGPFISRLLIQRLVTSNPTPGYIERVSNVFNNNGQGVRGDMLALVKAILLDEEARSCASLGDSAHGQLREPILRYTQFSSAIDKDQYYGRFWNVAYGFMEATGQIPLGSPSVFNFFLPDYQPLGGLAEAGLFAPEFQIHNSRTSIGYINEVNDWTVYNYLMDSWEDGDPWVSINLSSFEELAEEPEALINKADMMLCNGSLSENTRNIIKSAIEPMIWGDYRRDRARMTLYLIGISPDYAIFK